MILSSHLLSDVEDVCDRVVVYYGGRIKAKARFATFWPNLIQLRSPLLPFLENDGQGVDDYS